MYLCSLLPSNDFRLNNLNKGHCCAQQEHILVFSIEKFEIQTSTLNRFDSIRSDVMHGMPAAASYVEGYDVTPLEAHSHAWHH